MTAEPDATYGATMRVLHPAPGVVAFYDGRIPGRRLYSDGPNWLDDGAYSLGVATFTLVNGEDALVYDTHISLPHARLVRRYLEEQGVRRMRVVLSHWHDDHIAGNEIFADCEIIAHRLTAQAMMDHRAAIETAKPPIHPVVMPTTLYEESMALTVGSLPVELRHVDAHSLDGTVVFLPGTGLLLAGDGAMAGGGYSAQSWRARDHRGRRLSAEPDRGDPALCGQASPGPYRSGACGTKPWRIRGRGLGAREPYLFRAL